MTIINSSICNDRVQRFDHYGLGGTMCWTVKLPLLLLVCFIDNYSMSLRVFHVSILYEGSNGSLSWGSWKAMNEYSCIHFTKGTLFHLFVVCQWTNWLSSVPQWHNLTTYESFSIELLAVSMFTIQGCLSNFLEIFPTLVMPPRNNFLDFWLQFERRHKGHPLQLQLGG